MLTARKMSPEYPGKTMWHSDTWKLSAISRSIFRCLNVTYALFPLRYSLRPWQIKLWTFANFRQWSQEFIKKFIEIYNFGGEFIINDGNWVNFLIKSCDHWQKLAKVHVSICSGWAGTIQVLTFVESSVFVGASACSRSTIKCPWTYRLKPQRNFFPNANFITQIPLRGPHTL